MDWMRRALSQIRSWKGMEGNNRWHEQPSSYMGRKYSIEFSNKYNV
jgi:hypothetical protein